MTDRVSNIRKVIFLLWDLEKEKKKYYEDHTLIEISLGFSFYLWEFPNFFTVCFRKSMLCYCGIINTQTFTGEICVCVRLIGSIHIFSSQENVAQGTILRVDILSYLPNGESKTWSVHLESQKGLWNLELQYWGFNFLLFHLIIIWIVISLTVAWRMGFFFTSTKLAHY